MVVQVKAIIPGEVINVDAVHLELLNQFRKTGRRVKAQLKKPASTWKSKPEFNMKVSLRRTDKSGGVIVFTDNKIYKFLDGGTRVRWAVMSSNWRSKTIPRRLRSRKGRGKPVIVGRRAMRARNIKPRPGIQAREWTDVIAKREGRKWEKDVQAAIDKGLNKARG